MNKAQTVELAKQLFIKEVNSTLLNNEISFSDYDIRRLARRCFTFAKHFSEQISEDAAPLNDEPAADEKPIEILG